ncbi:MAG: hypothetical protein FWE43_01410 [Streptococcaceae bacterium]|nr:hypothetical protein [Streptococcaceae bacterium]
MRKSKIIIILGLISIFSVTSTYYLVKPVNADTKNGQPVYRLYNKNNKEHLYSTDLNEAVHLPELAHDWQYESQAWDSPDSGDTVYRVYNPQSGEHLNTKDANEVKVLTTKYKWKNEGRNFYSGNASTGKPVYRLFNPAAGVGAHFVTMDAHEKSVLVTRGWKYEGISFYELPRIDNSPSGTLPLLGFKTVSISGNIDLTGSGTGYQAKFTVNGTGEHAVSFGIQVDTASSFYGGVARGKAVYMSENINNASHVYTAYGYASTGIYQHIEIAYYAQSDTIGFYVNNKLVGTAVSPNFRGSYINTSWGKFLIANVGGSARVRGDKVNAQFQNVETTLKGMTAWNDTSNDWAGLNATWTNRNLDLSDFTVIGTSTLPLNLNWDTYGKAGLPTADGVAQISLWIN